MTSNFLQKLVPTNLISISIECAVMSMIDADPCITSSAFYGDLSVIHFITHWYSTYIESTNATTCFVSDGI